MAYTNSTGTRFETPLRDCRRDVVNHGTHHRAQIALVLREADGAPPPTDYIFFVRDA
ncbi:putative damage-inducible protein DinB [Salinibacter ruber]|uniref:DinB family protein n=1 Tax=Salinibacter ruber TaxID=146919 RepID=UPI00216811AD|nr:putative damage-inducible protein DinB [Salinibacter ruber]MCS3652739.1 putative damage-inducible protein DinB [Salinibacter ruber]